MRINTEERKTVGSGIAVIVAVLLILFFQTLNEPLQDWYGLESFYFVVGVINVALGFAVFTQAWTYNSNPMSRHRLYTGLMFLCALIPDFIYTLGMVGFPLFQWKISANNALWMLILSKLVLSLGVMFIFSFRDQPIKTSHKPAVLIVGTLAIATIISGSFALQSHLPLLMDEQGMTMFKIMLDTCILVIFLIALSLFMFQRRFKQVTSYSFLVRGICFFILGQILFMKSFFTSDLNHLLGLICGSVGSYLILRGCCQQKFQSPFEEEQLLTEAQISYLAYHDDLTGLPNLRRLINRLDTVMKSGSKVDELTIVVLNFNRFKTINESLGRDAGDRILQLASERITGEVKNGEEVYSMGGDEFAILLFNEGSAEHIVSRIVRFIDLFKEPVQLCSGEYHLSLSAGYAIYPEDGTEADQLVQNADTAVHGIKGQQINIQRYTPSMQLKAQERLVMETELRRGLEREEFFLEYQPLVWLETNQVVGMEALVRWNHPERGIVYPGEFISIAEDIGLIVPLGEWVLRQACQQNKQWQEAGYKPICVSINLSLGQFIQPNLPERIGTILDEIQLDPKYVELEITESMTLDKDTALDQMHRLKKLGVRISIDDFGTGYSSLHYLKNLPIDRLKIDKTFVNEILDDNNNAAIVSTIATMAHHLKLKVTAEGVETAEQLSFLRIQQCHEGQGYYFSRPIGAWDFERAFLVS